MKDWRRSPELPSMMGTAVLTRDTATQEEKRGGNADEAQQAPTSSSTPIKARHRLDVSLVEMAQRAIAQRIHLYDTFGDAPYRLVRPILEQCQPAKLYIIEEHSPQYISETDTIWRKNYKRDFRDIDEKQCQIASTSAGGWRELYRIKMIEQEEAREAATRRAKQGYAKLKADKQANRVQVMTELPTAKRRRGMMPVSRRGGIAAGSSSSPSMSQGQRMLQRARKQSQVNAQATRSSLIGRPASSLPSRQTLATQCTGSNSSSSQASSGPRRSHDAINAVKR